MLLESCWTALVHLFSFQSLFATQQSPLPPNGGLEYPLPPGGELNYPSPTTSAAQQPTPTKILKFKPIDASIECEYEGLSDTYVALPRGDQRTWLKPKPNVNGTTYDIHTNYETTWPKGKVRDYSFTVTESGELKPDGVKKEAGKYFEGEYPGRRIGVHVKNSLPWNGTAIHMHGICMFETGFSDGVPGVTQCPIAKNDTYTYEFTATQYGTTWYHSHYSLQYTDGLLGPLTIYGPASVVDYDDALEPLMLADRIHQGAFGRWTWGVVDGHQPRISMDTILINNHGSAAGKYQNLRYRTKKVTKGKKYLLRLINASTDTAFIFSIDQHKMTVIGTDLVPISPYLKDTLYIGIGQRYHVIVEADAIDECRNYWIRTQPATGCHNFDFEPNERQGIFVYNEKNMDDPISTPYVPPHNGECRDEEHKVLRPVFEWQVPPPTPDQLRKVQSPWMVLKQDDFRMPDEDGHDNSRDPTWSAWQIHDDPAWVNYKDLTINHLNDSHTWPPTAALFEIRRNESNWAYMVIDGAHQPKESGTPSGEKTVPAAHPMHLHGHDFALLKQSYEKLNDKLFDGNHTADLQKFIDTELEYNNPARRDVVLLPRGGYIVIAFKVDNPGAWLLHCHIAWHASGGLALQILEDKEKFQEIMKRKIADGQTAEAQKNQGCAKWATWYDNKANRWGNGTGRFQDDSGV
ncbi:hypothetical protein AtubIFM55763_005599 [Aspergillus tubingensis]|nr:hypothetical protein AtubIFM55763_005599 [Aspergillus tubingensis]